MITRYFSQIVDDLLGVFLNPNSRTWWCAILSAILISLIYESLRAGRTERSLLKGSVLKSSVLFSSLLHPSSRVDLKLMIIRSLVRIFLIASFPLTVKYIAVKTISVAYMLRGPPPLELEGLSLLITYSVCLFLVSDLSRYYLHYLMHRSPILWRFHQVHHSAEVLTPLTLYRIHPIEQLLQAARGGLVIGVTAGLFAWLSYGKATVWVIYGVPGVMILFSILGANLRHSHVRLPYPRWMEHLCISPAQHQIHHSVHIHHQNSNYGSVLAVWDYIFGHLLLSSEHEVERFGLGEEETHSDPYHIGSILLRPLRRSTFKRDR